MTTVPIGVPVTGGVPPPSIERRMPANAGAAAGKSSVSPTIGGHDNNGKYTRRELERNHDPTSTESKHHSAVKASEVPALRSKHVFAGQ